MHRHTQALVAQLEALLGPMAQWPGVFFGDTLTLAERRQARARMQCGTESIVFVYRRKHETLPSVVLSSEALYVCDPYVRIELMNVQWPAQPGPPPVFPLAEGPLALGPLMREDQPAVMALGTAWTAIVNANRQVAPPTPSPFEVPGPLAAHAHAVLRAKYGRVGPTNLRVDALIYDAVACVGTGLDPFAQEVPLAVLANPDDLTEMVLLTDQRLIARTPSGPVMAHYGALNTVQPGSTGLISASLVMHAPGATQVLKLGMLASQVSALGRFLFDVCALPPHERRAPPEVFAPPPDDVTGAKTARAAREGRDPQLAVLFDAISSALARGELTAPVGRDLVERARLLHRMELYARGMYQGLWLSALAPNDLAFLCGRVIGTPRNVLVAPSGVLSAEFIVRPTMGPSAGQYAGAAVSTAAGLAVGALFGVGWVSVPRVPKPVALRAVIHPAPWGSAFQLLATDHGARPVTETYPSIFARLDESLARGEQQLLFLRALFGWNPTAEALLSLPAETVNSRVRDLLGDASRLDVFHAT